MVVSPSLAMRFVCSLGPDSQSSCLLFIILSDCPSWSFSDYAFRFSTDEGQCWQSYTFTKEPIYFTGLASEPGARSMNISIWGFTESFLTRQWVSYTINFKDILERNCEYLL